MSEQGAEVERNVLGGPLQPCGTEPLTGFYRTGVCSSGPEDLGSHTVCTVVSANTLLIASGNPRSPSTTAIRMSSTPRLRSSWVPSCTHAARRARYQRWPWTRTITSSHARSALYQRLSVRNQPPAGLSCIRKPQG